MRVNPILLVTACAAVAIAAVGPAVPTEPPPKVRPATPPPSELVAPEGFPIVGKWMYTAGGEPAHWLGEVYHGRRLREPINVLVVDSFAASPEDAKARLVAACESAGYPARAGHSSDYLGIIGPEYFHQLPESANHAFSNHHFEMDNNHGRLFGPAPIKAGDGAAGALRYVFIGAFSRETVDPVTKVKHRYGSFNRARDEFAQSMDERTQFRIAGFVWLGNTLIRDPQVTSGDHDGVAVLLSAAR